MKTMDFLELKNIEHRTFGLQALEFFSFGICR